MNGAGNVISSKIAGRKCLSPNHLQDIYGFAAYADRIVKKCMEKRGYRRPEDRLKASFWGTLILMPISVLIYGWLLKFGCVLIVLTASPGLMGYNSKGGMAPPLIMVFLNGISLMLCLTPLNT